MHKIRLFEPKDMFSVIKLASITLTEQYNPSLFNYFYETFPEGFIVAEYGHKIIGFLIGVRINDILSKILMLSISKQYQNKRIGSDLLKYFLKRLYEEGVKFIELEVKIDNEKAINFYKKHGFKIRNEIKDFYQNGESAYTMKRQL